LLAFVEERKSSLDDDFVFEEIFPEGEDGEFFGYLSVVFVERTLI
jgi:hypothetical protein